MKDRSIYTLGGFSSILVGITYLIIGITELLLSRPLTTDNSIQSPFMIFQSNASVLLTQYWAMAIGAAFALAVIPAVSARVRHLNLGWVTWTSTLATIGFAVAILDNYWSIVMTGPRALAYQTGNEATRMALTVPGAAQFIDVQGWLYYGAVGLWVLVVSLLALRGSVFPRPLSYLGIVSALLYFLVVGTYIFQSMAGWILVLAAIGGIVVGPAWYIWMGIHLYRSRLPAREQEISPVSEAALDG